MPAKPTISAVSDEERDLVSVDIDAAACAAVGLPPEARIQLPILVPGQRIAEQQRRADETRTAGAEPKRPGDGNPHRDLRQLSCPRIPVRW